MNKILTVFLGVLVLLTFSRCKTQTVEPSLKVKIIGKWKYTGSSGGFAGKYDPANAKVANMIEFKSDGKYVRYINNDPDTQGTYDIIRIKSIYTGEDENAVRFDPRSDSPKIGLIANVKNDELTLGDNFNDGYTAGYVRVK
ncbi:MAG: hypothetical protein V4687_03385 [Bacteroidota bacterium]